MAMLLKDKLEHLAESLDKNTWCKSATLVRYAVAELGRKDEELARMAARLHVFEAELERLEAELERLQVEHTDLEAHYEGMDAIAERRARERDETDARVCDLEDELEACKKVVNRLQSRLNRIAQYVNDQWEKEEAFAQDHEGTCDEIPF
jgi:chromosome segregation ATPase